MQNYTLHTHTVGFDGRNTVMEMVNRAMKLGFETIGISNHFIVHHNMKKSGAYRYALLFGYNQMYSDNFPEVMQRFLNNYSVIDAARGAKPGIKILHGMEVDFFDYSKWHAGFEKAIKILKPDYIIGANHFVEYNGRLLNSHDWAAADAQTQEVLLKTYWNNIGKAAESGLFNWMAHLDLPKKVGLGREEKWAEYESRAMESIAKSNTAIEINTSFYKPFCYEPYPSNRILKMAEQNNVPVLLSDDAHVVDNIGRHFDEAEQLIQQFNLKRYNR